MKEMTFKEIKELFKEVAKMGKETDRRFKETDARIEKMGKETDRRFEETRESIKETRESIKETRESIKETRESIKETRESMKETDERIEKGFAETRKLIEKNTKDINKIGSQLGTIGFVQGEVAEDLISRNVKGLLEKRGMDIKDIIRNEKKGKTREYDIIVENGKEVALVEVKNKVRNDDISNFIEKQIPAFKKDYPKYKNKKIFGGIGGMVVKPHIEKNAEKRGLYVFTQNGEGGAVIANKKKFKPTAL